MTLFGADVPSGFEYRDEFIDSACEVELLEHVNRIAFSTFEMRGVVARRRVSFYGTTYDLADGTSPPIPKFLFPIRARFAEWAEVDPEAFGMALINEYRPGSPIGWHRDAPQYGITAGVSLLSSCRMRFRPYVAPQEAHRSKVRRSTTHEITLQPRSGYIIDGEARNAYEHSIPEVKELRYSITFRTLRSGVSA